jgi:NADH:ubiquinone oxidoreductase subunit C
MITFRKTPLLLFSALKLRDLITRNIFALRINCYFLEVTIQSKHSQVFFSFLQNSTALRLKVLSDIVCVDFPGKNPRFNLIYVLGSPYFNSRFTLDCAVRDLTSMPSLSLIFNSSSWAEREVWDLFGVPFLKNPDLRRILTDYGFSGYPLRKDFPLSGYLEVFYSISDQRVTRGPVSFAQEFRNFSFANPWSFFSDGSFIKGNFHTIS